MPKQNKDAKLTKAEQEAVDMDEQSAVEIAKTGRVPGQFIFSKERKPQRILGSIYFAGGKVSSIIRPIGDEDFAPWSQDAVGLARTLYRALAPTTGDSVKTVVLFVRHERATNAHTEVLSATFPDGRRAE